LGACEGIISTLFVIGERHDAIMLYMTGAIMGSQFAPHDEEIAVSLIMKINQ